MCPLSEHRLGALPSGPSWALRLAPQATAPPRGTASHIDLPAISIGSSIFSEPARQNPHRTGVAGEYIGICPSAAGCIHSWFRIYHRLKIFQEEFGNPLKELNARGCVSDRMPTPREKSSAQQDNGCCRSSGSALPSCSRSARCRRRFRAQASTAPSIWRNHSQERLAPISLLVFPAAAPCVALGVISVVQALASRSPAQPPRRF